MTSASSLAPPLQVSLGGGVEAVGPVSTGMPQCGSCLLLVESPAIIPAYPASGIDSGSGRLDCRLGGAV